MKNIFCTEPSGLGALKHNNAAIIITRTTRRNGGLDIYNTKLISNCYDTILVKQMGENLVTLSFPTYFWFYSYVLKSYVIENENLPTKVKYDYLTAAGHEQLEAVQMLKPAGCLQLCFWWWDNKSKPRPVNSLKFQFVKYSMYKSISYYFYSTLRASTCCLTHVLWLFPISQSF